MPGAAAPDFSLPGFWHSLPSLLLKQRGPFCEFFSRLLSADNHSAPTSSAWPSPLPYPAVFQAGCGKAPSWRHKRINLIVALLDWLHLGCPDAPPPGLGLGAPLTARQRRAIGALERLVDDSTTFFKLDAALMGRSAVKSEDHDRTLAALSRAMSSFEGDIGYFRGPVGKEPEPADRPGPTPRFDFGQRCGRLKLAEQCNAKPIVAARLKFPPPPSFAPRGFLDSRTQRLFDRPLDFEAPLLPLRPVPPVRIRATKDERLKLFRALAACGRLRPVRVPPERLHYAGGMFSVPKDLERDRLVLDGRPSNALNAPPAYWSSSMASAAVLLPMVLRPGESLRISSADLKDYFYLFQISEQRLVKNLLRGALSEDECVEIFGRACSEYAGSDGKVRVALSTLAMGDCAAVEFAQGSHLGVLYKNELLRPEELLVPNFPPPRGLLSIGVVIDDLVIFEKVTQAMREEQAGSDESQGGRRLDQAYAAYASEGLLAHPDKGTRNSAEASFWGVKLNGETGLLRTSPTRLGPLMMITVRVTALGLCREASFSLWSVRGPRCSYCDDVPSLCCRCALRL